MILQHPRERFHPLNTARILRLGLSRVRLEVPPVRRDRSLRHRLELAPGAGLLYPHDEARRLDRCPPGERPTELVVLDGTWSHARRLYEENGWLRALPHYALAPAQPGRYRIRGEPADHCLSTVEATVQALQVLEPETAGLDALLGVFDAMIDTQVEQIQGHGARPRYKRPRQRASRRVPQLLGRAPERTVVAYVETVPGQGERRPVHWVAWRQDTGECFERILRPSGPPPAPRQLAHMMLSPRDLERGHRLDQILEAWRRFLGEDPVVAAWNKSTLDVLRDAGGLTGTGVMLKAAYCNVFHGACGSLEAVVEREGLTPAELSCSGRAGQRLGLAVAVLGWLRERAGMAEVSELLP